VTVLPRVGAQSGGVIWLTGLSGAGKTTLGTSICAALRACGEKPVLLDGDELRAGLSADLGFSEHDRKRQASRVAYVASCIEEAGGWAVVCLISPYEASRRHAREVPQRFCLVHVAASLPVCESRDAKGLYVRARRGELTEFTGISAPYERPTHPEVRVGESPNSLTEDTEAVMNYLCERQWIELDTPTR